MATNNRTKAAPAAPEPQPQPSAADLLLAALKASAAAQPGKRVTSRSTAAPEALAQPLTGRDKAALVLMGWTGCRLSSPKPAEPRPKAKVKSGPVICPATFAGLTPERQASTQFWAGLCSVLARSGGRVWLPEAAAVAAHLGVPITGPAQLAARLSALTGLPVSRPVDAAGWLVCEISEPMAAASVWAQLWQVTAEQFGTDLLTR